MITITESFFWWAKQQKQIDTKLIREYFDVDEWEADSLMAYLRVYGIIDNNGNVILTNNNESMK